MDASLQNVPQQQGRHLPKQRSSRAHRRNRSTGSMNGSFSSLFQKTLNPAHHLRHRIVKKAAGVVDKYVTELTNKSPYLLSCDAGTSFEEAAAPPTIPLLDRAELEVGQLLGDGGFCNVYEVTSIHLKSNHPFGGSNEETDEGRLALAKAAPARQLAVKQLRKRLTKSPPQFTLAAADLVVEAHYLSRLSHAHICPVRAMTKGGVHAMEAQGKFDAYFLVLDRLETTLDRRIHAWQRGQELAPTYDQKLTWALQIAQALQYLHQRRILFRDVKPQNIGFRADTGELQLFDFGLCRELPPPRERPPKVEEEKLEEEEEEYVIDDEEEEEEEEEEDLDDYYLMTKVGTRRYCAVEMYISGRYNEKVDVYSWAMTVYEMISMVKPFASLTDADHQQYVCAQGKRPNPKPFLQQCEQTPRGQSNPFLELVREAWEQYVRYRLDMHTVVEQMQEIIGERQLRKQELLQQKEQELNVSSSTTSDKERHIEGSVVSTTTATVTESDHEEMESPIHPQGSRSSSLGSPPETPGNNKEDVKTTNDVSTNDVSESHGDDTGSIHSLIVVDIGLPGQSRHSLMSTPSLGTTSGSEQSARWDDSINTNEVGLMSDASLNNIAFDEYLKPRHRGCAVESPTSPPSKLVTTNTALPAVAAAALMAPTLTGSPLKPHSVRSRMDPPPLTRIVSTGSMELNDEDTSTHQEEEEEDAVKPTGSSNTNEQAAVAASS